MCGPHAPQMCGPHAPQMHHKRLDQENIDHAIAGITGVDPGFGRGGGAPASEAESCHRSGAEFHERSELSEMTCSKNVSF